MAETIIEIAGPHNEHALFGPLGERLRGRWNAHALSGRSAHESLAALHAALPEGYIPGICLAIDPAKQTGRRFDPLKETDEGRAIWQAIEPVLQQYAEFLKGGQPWDETVVRDLSPDALKTWVYDMRNLIDCGLARHISGPELPSLEKIREFVGARKLHNWIGPRSRTADIVEEAGGPIKQPERDASAAGV